MSGVVIVQLVVLWLVPAVWALVANVWPWPADQPPAPSPAPRRVPATWWAPPLQRRPT